MAHLKVDIVNQIATRLSAIVATTTNPVGGTYNYTPLTVYKGQRLADVETSDFPLYSVILGAESVVEYTSSRRFYFSELEIQIEARVSISDRTAPYTEALNAIEDIRAAVETDSTDMSLGDRVSSLLWASEDIDARPMDKTAFCAITYTCNLTHGRGDAANLKPAW